MGVSWAIGVPYAHFAVALVLTLLAIPRFIKQIDLLATAIGDLLADKSAPENVAAFIDPSKMARACGNILRNAIVYSNPSEDVAFSARRLDDEIVVETTDRGREISPEHLQNVFEKFFRTDAARNANAGGAGLGLAIAKEIVEAHGGFITAESDKGITTFTARIPQDPQVSS